VTGTIASLNIALQSDGNFVLAGEYYTTVPGQVTIAGTGLVAGSIDFAARA
jgi:hypothetical protein